MRSFISDTENLLAPLSSTRASPRPPSCTTLTRLASSTDITIPFMSRLPKIWYAAGLEPSEPFTTLMLSSILVMPPLVPTTYVRVVPGRPETYIISPRCPEYVARPPVSVTCVPSALLKKYPSRDACPSGASMTMSVGLPLVANVNSSPFPPQRSIRWSLPSLSGSAQLRF